VQKKFASSQKRKTAKDDLFKTIDEAFLRFFPSANTGRARWKGRESGAELAEKLFAKAARSNKNS
jgi:hypothetical protein